MEEDISEKEVLALEKAEGRMLKVCSPLNKIVKHKMEQADPGILLEMEVKNTIGDCDFATSELEQLISAQE